MKIQTFASVAVMGALGFLIPLQTSAFGLGKIQISSALNEPLKAVVPVTALREEYDSNLRVQLASNDEFNKAGLKRSFLLTQLKFEIVKTSGIAEVHITSEQPVKEPFLDFLIIASTANGRMVREYIVLLDPPKSMFNKPTKKVKQAVKQVSQNKAMPSSTVSDAQNSQWTSDTYDVNINDALSIIAKKTRPQSDISINQMMMALLNANQSAFIGQNINRLKANSTLRIPQASEIKQLSKKQALLAVNEQNKAWRNRNIVAPALKQEEMIAGDGLGNTPSLSMPEETNNNNNEDDVTYLELVAPSTEAITDVGESSLLGDEKLTKLTEQLTLAQETIESQVQENNGMKLRMDMMEEQLQTLHRLISLKDADLAKMQNYLQTEQLETTDDFNDVASETTTISNRSEVDDYFSQIGSSSDEIESDSAALTLTVDELNSTNELDNTQTTEQYDAVVKMSMQIVEETANNLLIKVKKFYALHRNESLLAGLITLLLLIWISIRARRGESENNDEQDNNQYASSTTASIASISNSELIDDADSEHDKREERAVVFKTVTENVTEVDNLRPESDLLITRPTEAVNELSTEFDIIETNEIEESDTSLAFNLDAFSVNENKVDFEADKETDPKAEEDDISFDLGDFEGIDEAETKLGLAAAYMDMGDPEGARNILEEVLAEGIDTQQSRAQDMLNELS
mgnify:CR=1 FL=1